MEISNEKRLYTANTKFLAALLKNSLSELIQAAYETFSAPIIIDAAVSQVIYQLPKCCIGEKIWDELILNNKTSLTEKETAELEYMLEKKLKNHVAYITDQSDFTYPHIVGEFFSNSFLAGHFVILFKDSEADEIDLQIARLFGEVLTNYFSNFSTSSHYLLNRTLLNMLLQGKKLEDMKLDRSLLEKLHGSYLLLICPMADKTKELVNDYIYNYMQNNFKNIYTAVYDHQLVLLCCALQPNISLQSMPLKSVIDFLLDYNYTISVSKEFTNLSDIKSYFNQTLLTLKVGQLNAPDRKVHHYEDYAPLQLLLPVVELTSSHIWYHPIFNKIKAWDKQYNTQYLDTLMKYLESSKNKKDTANALYIHINTLNYRLGKMRDLFDIDHLSQKEITEFGLNYYLYQLANEKQK